MTGRVWVDPIDRGVDNGVVRLRPDAAAISRRDQVPMTTAVAPRITELRHRQDEFLRDTVERRMCSPEEQRAAAELAPETFWQALQLMWFMHVFLYAESSASAISFGRLDQFLWPFLKRDLADGRITMFDAEELVACLWLKCCEGDESQNVVVGGCDSDRNGAENPLSLLCLKVTRDLRVWRPSVSVRVGPDTSEEFWEEALRLCAAGFGMPSFFNDPVVIDAVMVAGIPVERARDWGIVGCYEATPQGDCLARTVHGHWVLRVRALCRGSWHAVQSVWRGHTWAWHGGR